MFDPMEDLGLCGEYRQHFVCEREVRYRYDRNGYQEIVRKGTRCDVGR
jgi:hypothetical protein